MRLYLTKAVVRLSSGQVQLDDEQARARKHRLKHIEGDVYEIQSRIEFKAGEEIGYDQPVPKGMREQLVPVDGLDEPELSEQEVSDEGEEAELEDEPDAESGPDDEGSAPESRLTELGGGWYELPNGERVRGKDDAIDALLELESE